MVHAFVRGKRWTRLPAWPWEWLGFAGRLLVPLRRLG